MFCYKCGCHLSHHDFCPSCGADVSVYKKIIYASNRLYNDGLEKAKVRDLSGAINSLRQSLKLSKNNIEARNLLGLVYFEMGEVVAALSEWVISKNLRPEKNIADDYIDMIQNNATRLDAINQTIKKYNQSLSYCMKGKEKDGKDLAVIQLKKVLSLNPKFIRAHQLMALLMIEKEDWEAAKRELKKCLDIDRNNTLSLRYLKEVEEQMIPDENAKGNGKTGEKKSDDTIRYASGNDVIIQPVSMKSGKGNTAVATVINILIGLLIGVGFGYFQMRPAAQEQVRVVMQAQMNTLSDEIDAKNSRILELESAVRNLQTERQILEMTVIGYEGEDGTLADIDNLLEISADFLTYKESRKTIDALEILDSSVNMEEMSVSYKKLYDATFKAAGKEVSENIYLTGYDAYNKKDYANAADIFRSAAYYDDENDNAWYYLGISLRALENRAEEAINAFEKCILLVPGSERARRAQTYIDELSRTLNR